MATASEAAQRAGRPIPRTRGVRAFRHLLADLTDRVDMRSRLEELLRTHGPVVMLDTGIFRSVNLFGPDANRFVLLDRDRVFSAKRPWELIMGRIFPNGLLLRDGDDHKFHRKIMHQPFTRPALRSYAGRMNDMIASAVSAWAAREEMLAFPAFKSMTLDMAASIFLGVELGADNRAMNAAFERMVAASMSRVRLPIPGLEFHRGLAGRSYMKRWLGGRLSERRAGGGDVMLSRLCGAETEEGERFSDAEIVDHTIFLMMAAHDTTTSTLCSLACELARHPEWQERVRQESLAFGGEYVGLDDLDALPSLRLAMRETLRRYPPLPVIPRIATAEVEFEGFRIPEGAMVVVAPIVTHHLSEWWDEPERFDPERFSPGRAEHERHTHSWIPFGGGLHHCLGQRFAEMQVTAVVHQLARRVRWSVPEGYRMPVQQAPISKPLDGLPLRIEPI
jgi:cytochrome P450